MMYGETLGPHKDNCSNNEYDINVKSLGSSEKIKGIWNGPYCAISASETSSVALYKPATIARYVYSNFRILHNIQSKVAGQ